MKGIALSVIYSLCCCSIPVEQMFLTGHSALVIKGRQQHNVNPASEPILRCAVIIDHAFLHP